MTGAMTALSRGRRASRRRRIERVRRAHGGAGRRCPAAVPRGRPALADRLPGHAARAPDHAGPPADGRTGAGGAGPRGSSGARGRGALHPAALDRRPRTPSTWWAHCWPGRRAPAIRCAVSDRAWATTVLALQRRLPSAEWIDASVVTGAAPRRQGHLTNCPRCDGPVRRPTGWRQPCRTGGSVWSGGPRPTCRPTSPRC